MIVTPILIQNKLPEVYGVSLIDCIYPHYSNWQKEEKQIVKVVILTYRDIPGYPPELDNMAKFVSHG